MESCQHSNELRTASNVICVSAFYCIKICFVFVLFVLIGVARIYDCGPGFSIANAHRCVVSATAQVSILRIVLPLSYFMFT